jgi:hypothetical protein
MPARGSDTGQGDRDEIFDGSRSGLASRRIVKCRCGLAEDGVLGNQIPFFVPMFDVELSSPASRRPGCRHIRLSRRARATINQILANAAASIGGKRGIGADADIGIGGGIIPARAWASATRRIEPSFLAAMRKG